MDSQQSWDLIQKIKEFLIKVDAEEGILFGSRARGDELQTSDVDLIVISEKFSDMPFARRLVYLSQNWTLPYFLEALPYTRSELEQLSKTRGVVAEALKTGIRIKAA